MQHRGERRGLGGIFFDDLSDYDQEMLLSFATSNNCLLFCYSLLRKEPFFSLMTQLEEVYKWPKLIYFSKFQSVQIL